MLPAWLCWVMLLGGCWVALFPSPSSPFCQRIHLSVRERLLGTVCFHSNSKPSPKKLQEGRGRRGMSEFGLDWRMEAAERPAGVSVGEQEGDGKKWTL